MFRCKIGNTGKFNGFPFGKCVAYLYGAVIVNADDIPGICLLHIGPVLGHEDSGICNDDLLADPVVHNLHPPPEGSRTDPQEGNAITMGGVHIRLNFEYKPRKGFFMGRHSPRHRRSFRRSRRHLYKGIEQFPYSKVIDSAPEKQGGLIALQILCNIKWICRPFHKFHIAPQLSGLTAQQLIEARVGKILYSDTLPRVGIFTGRKNMHLAAIAVVNTLEGLPIPTGHERGTHSI